MTDPQNRQKITHHLAGIYAPILTPFADGGRSVDLKAFIVHLLYLRDAGVDGILLLGSNGEFGSLDPDEKWRLMETVERAETGLKVIIGATIPNSTEQTLAFAAEIDEHYPHAAALLVAPPYYARYARGETAADSEVITFYQHLLELRLSLPVLAYNLPVPMGGAVTAAVTPRIVRSIVAITAGAGALAGVKDSTGVVENVAHYLEAEPGGIVLCGNDHALADSISAGAEGSITAVANLFPSVLRRLWLADSADRDRAQSELSLLRSVIESVPGKMIAVQKLLLWRLGIVDRLSALRGNAQGLSQSEEATVRGKLRDILPQLQLNADFKELLQLP